MKAKASPQIDTSVFSSAMATFKEDYPNFAAKGWGPSAKAERWNGRHAMFGWFFIICTGYAQAHGLIPNPTQGVDFKTWGTLATISGKTTISNEVRSVASVRPSVRPSVFGFIMTFLIIITDILTSENHQTLTDSSISAPPSLPPSLHPFIPSSLHPS